MTEATCRGGLLLLLTAALVRDLPRYSTGQVLILSLGEDWGRSAGHVRSGDDGMPAPVPVPQVLEEADLVEGLGHVVYFDDSCEIRPLVNAVSASNARTVAVS